MTTDAEREARLRARLGRYGSALEEAVEASGRKPRRHLVAVDGPVPRGRPSSGRGRLARVAAVVVVLAALGGATWAATRSDDSSATTARAGAGWQDDDVVRPEDRPTAFAALDGTWPLPPGGSLRFVLDRPTGASTSFAGFRRMLADGASCLWFRHALEQLPGLPAEDQDTIAAMPGWPGQDDPARPAAARARFQEVVDAALAGDADRLRDHLGLDCVGTAVGLGLPEIEGDRLVPARPGRPATAPITAEGAATEVEPAAIRGWAAIAARLGPDVEVLGAVALPDGAYNVSLRGHHGLDLSLTIGTVRQPIELPVDEADFDRGHEQRDDGVELFVGPVGHDATVAHVVGPAGGAITVSLGAAPDAIEATVGDLDAVAGLAIDLHAAAWPVR